MTLVADDKSRLRMGDLAKPRQVFELEQTGPDEFRLMRLPGAAEPRLTLKELYAPVRGAGFKPGRARRETVRAIALA
jgi:hypothetical protein